MPNALNRLSDVVITSVGDRIAVQFDVGVTDVEFARVDALIAAAGLSGKKSAVVRAIDVSFEDGTNIDPRYHPKVSFAGDPRNLAGPVRYVLSVRNRGPKTTALMLKNLFSDKNLDHVLNLKINFAAQLGGQPYIAQTAVPVMAGTRDGVKPFEPPKEGIVTNFYDAPLAPLVRISMDKDSGCWAKSEVGVICLR
jgi:hypothetical protein